MNVKTDLPLGGEVLQIGYGRLGRPFYKYMSTFFNVGNGPELIKSFRKDLKEKIKNYKYVFLCTTDSSLLELVNKYDEISEKVIHFSGAHFFENAIGIHPIYSFPLSDEEVNFKSINFIVDQDIKNDSFLNMLFKKQSFLSSKEKKNYHTYLSLAANYMQLLSSELSISFGEETGLKKSLLLDIVKQSIENVEKYGEKSFSGPWIRGERIEQDLFAQSHNAEIVRLVNKNFTELIKLYERKEKHDNS